jgi:HSP20 family protein
MALFADPFNALAGLQQAMEDFRASSWLTSGPSGGGSYPPMNVFRKNDDFIIIAEVPGIRKSDLTIQVKGKTLRLAGGKTVNYPEKAGLHAASGYLGDSIGP